MHYGCVYVCCPWPLWPIGSLPGPSYLMGPRTTLLFPTLEEAERHREEARGYQGRCPSLPRRGRVCGRPSRRSEPRDGRPSSRHPWGCRSWCWWGGGVAVVVLWGLVGLGAGTAFVGRAVVVIGGGFGSFRPGDRPVVAFVGRLERKLFLLGGGLGGVGMRLRLGGAVRGGVGGHPPLPPLLPVAHPAPSHAPPHLLIPPPPAYPTSCIRAHSLGRNSRDDTQMPLTTRAASQLRRPRKRARPRGGSQATMRRRAPKGTH